MLISRYFSKNLGKISIYTKREEQLIVANSPGDIKVAAASFEREKRESLSMHVPSIDIHHPSPLELEEVIHQVFLRELEGLSPLQKFIKIKVHNLQKQKKRGLS